MNIYKRLGINLRNARHRRRLSQKELAEKLGCSSTHIGNIENATVHCTIGELERIAAALDVDYIDLIVKRDT